MVPPDPSDHDYFWLTITFPPIAPNAYLTGTNPLTWEEAACSLCLRSRRWHTKSLLVVPAPEALCFPKPVAPELPQLLPPPPPPVAPQAAAGGAGAAGAPSCAGGRRWGRCRLPPSPPPPPAVLQSATGGVGAVAASVTPPPPLPPLTFSLNDTGGG